MRVLFIGNSACGDHFLPELRERFAVTTAVDIEDGELWLKMYGSDAVVLVAPVADATSVRVLRNAGHKTPIIVLSSQCSDEAMARVLQAGADDCRSHETSFPLLSAIIHTAVRRAQRHGELVVRVGKLVVDLQARSVVADGRTVTLPMCVYAALECLALRAQAVVPHETIFNHVYGDRDISNRHVLSLLFHRLRKGLQPFGCHEYVHNVWGVGYALREP